MVIHCIVKRGLNDLIMSFWGDLEENTRGDRDLLIYSGDLPGGGGLTGFLKTGYGGLAIKHIAVRKDD